MQSVRPRSKSVFGSLAVLGFVALILLITATAALGGVWLPGQEPSEPVSAPHHLDQMYRPSIRTLPPMRLPAPPKPKPVPAPHVHSVPAPGPSGSCYAEPGTPPASVLHKESKGDPKARNPSGAAGCWQFMPGTWAGYGGYSSADQAPVAVQNERAKQVWAGGDGCRHWRATASC